MRKYNKITLNLLKVETENILGASAITGGNAQHTNGGVTGGNGGDANARSNAGGSTIGFDADLL